MGEVNRLFSAAVTLPHRTHRKYLIVGLSLLIALFSPLFDHTAILEGNQNQQFEDARAVLALNPNWKILCCPDEAIHPLFDKKDLIIIEESSPGKLTGGMLAFYDNGRAKIISGRVEHTFLSGSSANVLPASGHQSRRLLGVVIGILRGDREGPTRCLNKTIETRRLICQSSGNHE